MKDWRVPKIHWAVSFMGKIGYACNQAVRADENRMRNDLDDLEEITCERCINLIKKYKEEFVKHLADKFKEELSKTAYEELYKWAVP